jgi:hypothetical protein
MYLLAAARPRRCILFSVAWRKRRNNMEKQLIAAFRKNAVVPFIIGGAIIVAVPTFIFLLIRLVCVRAIKDTLAPAAVKQLDAWRSGQVKLASRPGAVSSLTASIKNEWLPASVRQVTAALGHLNRRKGF